MWRNPVIVERLQTGDVEEDQRVDGLRQYVGYRVSVDVEGQDTVYSDKLVIASASATGTWLAGLARQFGVRQVVQAGRGYSFSVKPPVVPTHPTTCRRNVLPARRWVIDCVLAA